MQSETGPGYVDRAGLLVIGDELLCGSRHDRHLAHAIMVLGPRGIRLDWCHYAGDEQRRLADTLRRTRDEGIPVFCFGGIGATPDDRTRQAAARAFGLPLVRNLGAVRSIVERFGADATPVRLRMADLPAGCTLIPNPVNGIPGFSVGRHHFFPGFPQLAWPMLDWVLDHCYEGARAVHIERSVRVRGVAESALVGMMESIMAHHPRAHLFSLPELGVHRCVELGFRGEVQHVEAALAELVAELVARGLPFERLAQPEGIKPSA